MGNSASGRLVCVLVGVFGLVGFGWLLGFACVLFPIIMLVFPFPFNDDLGTPPTWRPHSWKKKHTRQTLLGVKGAQVAQPIPPLRMDRCLFGGANHQ